MVHQNGVDHGGLIHDQQVAIQRIFISALKSALLKTEFQQPVNGFGLPPGGFTQALGRPTGGGCQRDLQMQPGENFYDRLGYGGLARTGPAGDDHHLVIEGAADGRLSDSGPG